MNGERFDLVIVGASFAGLVAAKTAAMRGLKVAVLEAKPDAGARVHTTGILVKEAADELDIPHDLTRRIHGVRLYAPNLSHTDLFSPGYFFLTTRTAQLLRWLAREALRAGVRLYFGVRFEGAERDGAFIRLSGPDLTTRFLIGADGARSRVAKVFGLGRNSRFLTGVEAEFTGLDRVDGRFLHCFVDSRIAPGYLAWAAPGPCVTQVGLATNQSMRPDLSRFLDKTQNLFAYDGAEIVERRAGRIPCGGIVEPLAAPGVLLVGDAAGMVSPLTGGGIKLAFQYGRRAAQLVSDHLLDLGPEPDKVLAAELPTFARKQALRWALDRQPSNRLWNALLATPLMRAFARRVYFHRRGGQGLSLEDFEARIAALDALDALRACPHARLGRDR